MGEISSLVPANVRIVFPGPFLIEHCSTLPCFWFCSGMHGGTQYNYRGVYTEGCIRTTELHRCVVQTYVAQHVLLRGSAHSDCSYSGLMVRSLPHSYILKYLINAN